MATRLHFHMLIMIKMLVPMPKGVCIPLVKNPHLQYVSISCRTTGMSILQYCNGIGSIANTFFSIARVLQYFFLNRYWYWYSQYILQGVLVLPIFYKSIVNNSAGRTFPLCDRMFLLVHRMIVLRRWRLQPNKQRTVICSVLSDDFNSNVTAECFDAVGWDWKRHPMVKSHGAFHVDISEGPLTKLLEINPLVPNGSFGIGKKTKSSRQLATPNNVCVCAHAWGCVPITISVGCALT